MVWITTLAGKHGEVSVLPGARLEDGLPGRPPTLLIIEDDPTARLALACMVAERTREIGIRVALGAASRDVRRLVVRQGLALTGIGLATGFLGAYLLAPVIDRLLISMPATDPVTFAGTALLLTVTTLVASYLPARRATRIDPILTLKNE